MGKKEKNLYSESTRPDGSSYKVHPNQKRILCAMPSRAAEPFMMISDESISKAMLVLSGNAFKLFVYIGKNKHDYEFALSAQDVMCKCDMSRRTYYSAVNELIEAGYLVKSWKQEGDWYFVTDNSYGDIDMREYIEANRR